VRIYLSRYELRRTVVREEKHNNIFTKLCFSSLTTVQQIYTIISSHRKHLVIEELPRKYETVRDFLFIYFFLTNISTIFVFTYKKFLIVWRSLTISNKRRNEGMRTILCCGVGWTVDLWKTLASYDSLLASNFATNIDKVASERVGNFSVTFHRPFHPLTCCPPCIHAGASQSVMGELSLAWHHATMQLPFVLSLLVPRTVSLILSKGNKIMNSPLYILSSYIYIS